MYSGKALPRWVGYGTTFSLAATALAVLGFKYVSNVAKSVSLDTKTYQTAPAQRATVTLSDGTRVTLAPETKLKVTGRVVTLVGEAMFVVSHNTDTPFLVQTGTTTVKVLGTTFGVRQYASELHTRVAVAEGRIAVGEAILNSGDLAIATGNRAGVQHDAERVLSWLAFSQGTLSLETQTLAEAAPELSRWLDLDIQISPSATNRRLRAKLKNISPDIVLKEIAELTETSYTRKGRTVIFTTPEE